VPYNTVRHFFSPLAGAMLFFSIKILKVIFIVQKAYSLSESEKEKNIQSIQIHHIRVYGVDTFLNKKEEGSGQIADSFQSELLL
jgi:hypothetical protein